jgi:hypothetical protein
MEPKRFFRIRTDFVIISDTHPISDLDPAFWFVFGALKEAIRQLIST